MSLLSKWCKECFRWKAGRQSTGYERMLIALWDKGLHFDCYILRYRPGAYIPEHVDPVSEGRRHYRLNYVLSPRASYQGGEFCAEKVLFRLGPLCVFRPDIVKHSVLPVVAGTRYVLSVGWTTRS